MTQIDPRPEIAHQPSLSRQVVDHPRFQLEDGMLVRVRKDGVTWTEWHRFRQLYDYHLLPVNWPQFKERFDIFLRDHTTAAILLRMYMELGGPRRVECFRHPGRSERKPDGTYVWVPDRFEWTIGAAKGDELGVVVARALLVEWGAH